MSDNQEEAEEFNELDAVDSLAVIRTMLTTAITLGAAIFNSGDAQGCADVYQATARMLCQTVPDCEVERQLLLSALEAASVEPDVTEQAWILRRTFDEILGE